MEYIQLGKEVIGYTSSRETEILEAAGDTERNFIFLYDLKQPFYIEKRMMILCRSDKTIPEPSADSIDSIHYIQNYVGGEKTSIKNIITDKSIIEELINTMESGVKMSKLDLSSLEGMGISLICTSDEVAGASYLLGILRNGEDLMCGN